MSKEKDGPKLTRRRLMQYFGAGGALAAAPVSSGAGASAAATGAPSLKVLGGAMFNAIDAALEVEALTGPISQARAVALSTQMQQSLGVLARSPGGMEYAVQSVFPTSPDTAQVLQEVYSLLDHSGVDLLQLRNPAQAAKAANDFYRHTMMDDKTPSTYDRLQKLFKDDGSVMTPGERLGVMLDEVGNAHIIPKHDPSGEINWIIRGDDKMLLEWIAKQMPVILPGTDVSARAGQLIVYPRLQKDHESPNAKTLYETMEALLSAYPEPAQSSEISM